MGSPTQRSLKLLRDEGFEADVVERYNAHTRRKNDLFGVLDIVAVGRGMTVGCQTTSDSNLASRATKIRASEALQALEAAGWSVIVHGWSRRRGIWHCRELVILPGRPLVASKTLEIAP